MARELPARPRAARRAVTTAAAPDDWLVAELGPGFRPAITRHLLALDPDDRRLRFGLATSDNALRRYVRRIDFERDTALGVFDGQARLLGFGHLALVRGAAEFGVSVAPAARQRGIGTRLLLRAAALAHARGATELRMHYLPENRPLEKMAARAGMQRAKTGADAVARWTLPPPRAEAGLQAALVEAINALDLGVRRLVAADRPPPRRGLTSA